MLGPGDHAFTAPGPLGSEPELVYAGATSFLRRLYTREISGADVVISGVPYDLATTYRPGARLGPRALRAASTNLCFGKVWPWNLDPFATLAVIDWGDVVSDEGYPDRMVAAVEAHADTVLSAAASMLTLGGDHYISLPLLRAHARRHGPLALVHFDAHSDSWRDARHNHGSVFLHALAEGLIDAQRSVQVGIRTYNAETHGLALLTAPWVHDHGADATADAILTIVGDGPAYLTFDVDCLDPSCAPGTGTPVTGGLTTAQAQAVIRGLVDIDFVAMDVVEVSPPYDVSELTALAGATLALDYLCLLASRRLGRGRPDPYQGGSTTNG